MLLCVCNLVPMCTQSRAHVHNVCMNLVHISRSVMHNVYMQALCNCMNLVRIPRRDHMYLAYVYMCDSRRDRGKRSRSPKLMMRRSRSCLVENEFVVMYIVS